MAFDEATESHTHTPLVLHLRQAVPSKGSLCLPLARRKEKGKGTRHPNSSRGGGASRLHDHASRYRTTSEQDQQPRGQSGRRKDAGGTAVVVEG